MANPFECVLGGQGEPPPWPVHPAPLEDELLSSWFARLAYANHQSASSFAAVACPGRRLLRHDLDRLDDATLLAMLAARARVTPERLRAATLAAHTGRLYVTAHTNAPWLLPMWRQKSQAAAGLAFCPDCLAQSAQPYFRRCWRLAFVTHCGTHERLLRRGCPHCGAAVRLFDAPMDYQHRVAPEPPHVCLRCDYDLRCDNSLTETPLAGCARLSKAPPPDSGTRLDHHGARQAPLFAPLF